MQRLEVLAGQVAPENTVYGGNTFAHVQMAPADPILSLTTGYKNDKDPKKVNLGVGAYRDDNGKPLVFPVVKKVEKEIVEDMKLDKEYAPIDGIADFTAGARKVLFGTSPRCEDGTIASAQTLSGTGALRVLAEFLKKFRNAPIYISNPTWGNHNAVFASAGMDIRSYTYYNPKTRGLNLEGMLKDLRNAQPGSIVLLHTCAHNPTGVDPTPEQWHQIAEVMKQNDLFPYFDTAYQGFASGDLTKDGYGLRYFLKEGFQMVVAQSFAKIMGLYGERTGALHVVCKDKETRDKVLSQLKIVIRQAYSSPPLHGARIAARILNNQANYDQWMGELTNVVARMNKMRVALKAALQKQDPSGNWEHITNQIGMFSFTGLNAAQSDAMVKKHHVYMTKNGRISIAGLTTANVDYVAAAIKDVITNVK